MLFRSAPEAAASSASKAVALTLRRCAACGARSTWSGRRSAAAWMTSAGLQAAKAARTAVSSVRSRRCSGGRRRECAVPMRLSGVPASRARCGMSARPSSPEAPVSRIFMPPTLACARSVADMQRFQTPSGAGLPAERKQQKTPPWRGFFGASRVYLTRARYSSVRVSISILSPISTKAGTGSSKPVARRAGFMTLPEVSPLTAGSV